MPSAGGAKTPAQVQDWDMSRPFVIPGGALMLALAGCTSHPSAPSAPALSLSTLSRDFGGIPVGGRSEPVRFSVANRGEAPSGVLVVSIVGPNAVEFALVRDQCTGQAVQEVASCILDVELRPTVAGPKQATLTVIDPRGPDVSAALTGSAADAGLGITPATHQFPPMATGAQSPVVTFVVRNTVVQPTGAILAAISGADAADFDTPRNTCDGQSLPFNGTCVVDIRFAPGSAGSKQATLSVSASPGGSAAAQVSGVGTDQ